MCDDNSDCPQKFCCSSNRTSCIQGFFCYTGDGKRQYTAACSSNSDCATDCCDATIQWCSTSNCMVGGLSTAAIIGIIFAVIIVVIIGLIILCCCCCARRRRLAVVILFILILKLLTDWYFRKEVLIPSSFNSKHRSKISSNSRSSSSNQYINHNHLQLQDTQRSQ